MDVEENHQTVLYIPYAGPESDADLSPGLPSEHNDSDLEDGARLRLAAYKDAWTRCLDRIKLITAELYNPIVSDITTRLGTVHSDVVPGLPYPELPVITIADLSSDSLFLDTLSARLDPEADAADGEGDDPFFVNHLYPSDCLNMTSAMKNLISGFIETLPRWDTAARKRKPATSLVPYDLGLLQAWYDSAEESSPNLVVLLHDFEQFDSSVVQDMLYICSLRVSSLPLTFILSLSNPSPSSYLQASFTRSTLALLRIYHYMVPSGPVVLDAIIRKTFFDPTFEPLLFPGTRLLEFVQNYYTEHNASLNALITALQVAHLKHYSSTPLSLLASTNPFIPPNPAPSHLRFLEALLATMHLNAAANTSKIRVLEKESWRAHSRSPGALLQAVDSAREAFARAARMTRLGVSVLHLVVTFLQGSLGPTKSSKDSKLLDVLSGVCGIIDVLDNNDDPVLDGLAGVLGKLPAAELEILLGELHRYYQGLPPQIHEDHTAARSQISSFMQDLMDSEKREGVRPTVANWVQEHIEDLLQPLEDSTPLWGIWYTGFTPFPSDLLNPALRPSVISGLAFPRSYCEVEQQEESKEETEDDEENLQDLPDTSILFKGYVRAGKTMNVYDWFDHFRHVAEAQRYAALATGKGKGKARKPKKAEADDDDEMWKLSVQARFMRALHELDYLGFVKHTGRGGGGRKGEYILRTVLGVVVD